MPRSSYTTCRMSTGGRCPTNLHDNGVDGALDAPPIESSAAEPPAQSPSKEERQAVLATGKTTSPSGDGGDNVEDDALVDPSTESSAAAL